MRHEGFIKTANLRKTSEQLADVLESFGVFGDPTNQREMKLERRGFVNSVVDHLLKAPVWSYLERTHSASQVRLIVIPGVKNNDGYIAAISAHDHPDENPDMDYEALNEALKAVIRVTA